MDALLARVTQQAVQYAVRSGVSITASYAIKQCGRLLEHAPKCREQEELLELHKRLEGRIRILSPSIDLIELIAARGNTTLESAVSLTRDIRREFQQLGDALSTSPHGVAFPYARRRDAKSLERASADLNAVGLRIKSLISRIDDAVPLINLAIATSGVSMSTNLSRSISPSRLLQASTFLISADAQFISQPAVRQQVGPTFALSMYMLFVGHAVRPVDGKSMRETTWKEVIHKAHVKLWRVRFDHLCCLPAGCSQQPISTDLHNAQHADFVYQLTFTEDLDDGRMHVPDEGDEARVSQQEPFDGVVSAGVRDVIPIHEVSKIFYADTGKLLNLNSDTDANNPVLLIKRDVHATPPQCISQQSQSCLGQQRATPTKKLPVDGRLLSQSANLSRSSKDASDTHVPLGPDYVPTSSSKPCQRLPTNLDPEWVAFEVYTEECTSDSDSDDAESQISSPLSFKVKQSPDLISKTFAELHLSSSTSTPMHSPSPTNRQGYQSAGLSPSITSPPTQPPYPGSIKTSLSLLEVLMKLCALQQYRQDSHLAIEDEMLNFFLEDGSIEQSGESQQHRQRLRHKALQRVGFDPYNESPVKKRGESYIQNVQAGTPPSTHSHAKDSPDMHVLPSGLSDPSQQNEGPPRLRPIILDPLSSALSDLALPSP